MLVCTYINKQMRLHNAHFSFVNAMCSAHICTQAVCRNINSPSPLYSSPLCLIRSIYGRSCFDNDGHCTACTFQREILAFEQIYTLACTHILHLIILLEYWSMLFQSIFICILILMTNQDRKENSI